MHFNAAYNKLITGAKTKLAVDPGSIVGSWRYAPRAHEKSRGAQIDLLFDQSNGVITVCEIKHSENSFIIDKDYAQNLKEKINIYQQHTRTQKQIFLAMITSGVSEHPSIRMNSFPKKFPYKICSRNDTAAAVFKQPSFVSSYAARDFL